MPLKKKIKKKNIDLQKKTFQKKDKKNAPENFFFIIFYTFKKKKKKKTGKPKKNGENLN